MFVVANAVANVIMDAPVVYAVRSKEHVAVVLKGIARSWITLAHGKVHVEIDPPACDQGFIVICLLEVEEIAPALHALPPPSVYDLASTSTDGAFACVLMLYALGQLHHVATGYANSLVSALPIRNQQHIEALFETEVMSDILNVLVIALRDVAQEL